MAPGWKTVRIFISSTFRDMQAERDHLVRFVFPRLREVLLPRRIHLVDVDLRWGVTGDQDAFELCMDEIDRCRPRFLCMLGGRYGWVPPAETGAATAGRSITASEVHYAALDKTDSPAFRYFYFRDPSVTASIPEPFAADYREADGSRAAAQLAELKTRIRSVRALTILAPGRVSEAPLPVLEYPCAWDPGTARITNLDAFGNAVYADVLASIDAEFGAESAEPTDPDDEERAAMDAFAEERVERYVVGSREPVFQALAAHAAGRDGSGLLCVVGAQGSGKTALLARFARDCRDAAATGRRGEGPLVLAHFVGASAASTNVRLLLGRLCRELGAAAGVGGRVPEEFDALREAFPAALEKAAAVRPVLLLIDAVNQFDAAFGGPGLRWLPESLPSGVRAVLSTLPGPAMDALRARRQPVAEVPLEPLTAADATAVLDGFLSRYRKRLDETQRRALLAKADAGVPLYLLTALEELRTLGTYEEITARIEELPDHVQQLFTWILERLERDPGFRDGDGRPIGTALVRRYASCLAAGRSGMAQGELAGLVSPDDPPRGVDADALGNAAALQRLLRPYLMRRGDLLDFFHGQLREAVSARYLSSPAEVRAVHRSVAEHFRHRADPAVGGSWAASSVRALAELPYHLIRAEMWDEVHAVLTDLAFLEAKCTRVSAATTGAGDGARTVFGGVYDLLEDYRLAIESLAASRGSASNQDVRTTAADLAEWVRFFRSEAHVLCRHPDLLVQQAASSPASLPPARAADSLLQRDFESRPWLRRLNRPRTRGNQQVTLAGHTGPIQACAFSRDGSRIATCALDGFLRVWDAHSGREIAAHRVGTAAGSCLFLPGDEYLLCGSYAGPGRYELGVYDAHSGHRAAEIVPSLGALRPEILALSADGRLAAVRIAPPQHNAVGDDLGDRSVGLALSVFDTFSGRETTRLAGHALQVAGCAFSPDGTALASISDDDVKLWRVADGAEIASQDGFPTFERAGHPSYLRWRATAVSVAFDQDGRTLMTFHRDRTLKRWEAATLRPVSALQLEMDDVEDYAVAIAPAQNRVVVASRVIVVLDGDTGRALSTAGSHNANVTCVSLSPDGSRIATGAIDATVKTWSASGGVEPPQAVHLASVRACAFSPDGRLMVSGDASGGVRAWDAADGRELTDADAGAWVEAFVFSSDSRRLVAKRLGEPPVAWQIGSGLPPAVFHRLGGDPRTALVAGPAGDILAVTRAGDAALSVWNLAEESPLSTCRWNAAAYQDGDAFSHRGSWLLNGNRTLAAATAGQGQSILRLWDVSSGAAMAELIAAIGDWLFSEAQPIALSFGASGASLWDLGRGLTLRRWDDGDVTACVFSPDARWFACGYRNGQVVIRRADATDDVRALPGHRSPIRMLSVTPDGRRMASLADDDPCLLLWNVETGEALNLDKWGGRVSSAAFSPTGEFLLTSGEPHGDSVVREAVTGRCVARYPASGDVCCWSPSGLEFAIAGMAGEHSGVHLLRLERSGAGRAGPGPEPWDVDRMGPPIAAMGPSVRAEPRAAPPPAAGSQAPEEEPRARGAGAPPARRSWWRRFLSGKDAP